MPVSHYLSASLSSNTLLEADKLTNTHSWFFQSQFSHSVVSDSLRPHEQQQARPPCPSPIPGVYSNWCPSGPWCHPAISSSVVPFSSCPQSLPASGSFPVSQLFAWGGQSIGVSAQPPILRVSHGRAGSLVKGLVHLCPRHLLPTC